MAGDPFPSVACAELFGIRVHDGDRHRILERLGAGISQQALYRHIVVTNTESMYFARRIPGYRDYINSAEFSVCDGIGVSIAARLEGHAIRRLTGPDLMLEACLHGVSLNWRHYFLGGRPGVADLLAKKLSDRYPGLIVAGTFSPPFGPQTASETEQMLTHVRDSRPDFLWVGLGVLKQEAWITRYASLARVPWAIGVGAAFDFHAGTARWAPSWIRSMGLEWVYRTVNEPRMLSRQVRGFTFLAESVIKAIIGTSVIFGEPTRHNNLWSKY